MKLELSIPKVADIIQVIQKQPERLFEMIRVDIRQSVSELLSGLIKKELEHFLGRAPYEREGDGNYRNGTYNRHFTLKGIGKVKVDVPRDQKKTLRLK